MRAGCDASMGLLTAAPPSSFSLFFLSFIATMTAARMRSFKRQLLIRYYDELQVSSSSSSCCSSCFSPRSSSCSFFSCSSSCRSCRSCCCFVVVVLLLLVLVLLLFLLLLLLLILLFSFLLLLRFSFFFFSARLFRKQSAGRSRDSTLSCLRAVTCRKSFGPEMVRPVTSHDVAACFRRSLCR